MFTPKQSLKQQILERHGSIYRFLQAHGDLPVSTVYQVISGTYKGDMRVQRDRILDALRGGSMDKKVFAAIKGAACSRCTSRGDCEWCDAVFQSQARAVMRVVEE